MARLTAESRYSNIVLLQLLPGLFDGTLVDGGGGELVGPVTGPSSSTNCSRFSFCVFDEGVFVRFMQVFNLLSTQKSG
jgi:hypothetical protein